VEEVMRKAKLKAKTKSKRKPARRKPKTIPVTPSQPEASRGRGRPGIELTDTEEFQIEEMAVCQNTNEDIARIMGFSVDTLTRKFAEILDKGRARGRNTLRMWQWNLAKSGNVVMCIWLGKQMLGQRNEARITVDPHTGTDQMDVSQLTTEELTELERLLVKAAPVGVLGGPDAQGEEQSSQETTN
jgi:hypothetical protein